MLIQTCMNDYVLQDKCISLDSNKSNTDAMDVKDTKWNAEHLSYYSHKYFFRDNIVTICQSASRNRISTHSQQLKHVLDK